VVDAPWPQLYAAADAARERAHAPYSRFRVGVALHLDDGSIVTGCNVENASYGLTVCAERNAIGAMVVAGRALVAVALVVDSGAPTPPCGACRQVLAEFGEPTLEIRSKNLAGEEARWTLGELLPSAFNRSFL
jgi:cytidine deaminase